MLATPYIFYAFACKSAVCSFFLQHVCLDDRHLWQYRAEGEVLSRTLFDGKVCFLLSHWTRSVFIWKWKNKDGGKKKKKNSRKLPRFFFFFFLCNIFIVCKLCILSISSISYGAFCTRALQPSKPRAFDSRQRQWCCFTSDHCTAERWPLHLERFEGNFKPVYARMWFHITEYFLKKQTKKKHHHQSETRLVCLWLFRPSSAEEETQTSTLWCAERGVKDQKASLVWW